MDEEADAQPLAGGALADVQRQQPSAIEKKKKTCATRHELLVDSCLVYAVLTYNYYCRGGGGIYANP